MRYLEDRIVKHLVGALVAAHFLKELLEFRVAALV